MLEPFIVTHIIPEFSSPVAYIRARVCWVVEYFDDFSNSNKQTFDSILKVIISF